MNQPLTITVQELAQRFQNGQEGSLPLQLVDVREPSELSLASLADLGFRSYPLSDYEQWSRRIGQELDPSQPVYVLCHHGMRSAQMAQWLCQQGFTHVFNIQGGIAAWAQEIDPSVGFY